MNSIAEIFVNSKQLLDGISNFVDWVSKQQIEKDNYEQSIKEMKEKGL